MKTQWTDTTNYGQRDKDRTPRSWTWETADLRIKVHRLLAFGWFVTCHQVKIACESLGDVTLDQAKFQAVELVRRKVDDFRKQLETHRG
jgi:hypothetical protein